MYGLPKSVCVVPVIPVVGDRFFLSDHHVHRKQCYRHYKRYLGIYRHIVLL